MIREVIEGYHPDLVAADVRVNALMAWSKAGDPVRLQGYPCAAVIRKNSVRDRIEGKADATITIDEERWENLDERGRVALIDHELYHLVPQVEGTDAEGRRIWKTDSAGRPVLKIRLHDWELGGFAEIAERHGNAAIEVRAWQRVNEDFRQLVFAWTDDTIGSRDGERTELGQQMVASLRKFADSAE